MSEPFLSEIRMVGFNFAPRGWAFCDGQILPINQNQSLYSLLGTAFGGDGRTSFALPDLRGRVPLHFGSDGGSNYALGQRGGEETHTLTGPELPVHTHTMKAANLPPNRESGDGNFVTGNAAGNFTSAAPDATMNTGLVANTGGGQAHENMQPFQTVNFCIALQGLFPSRN